MSCPLDALRDHVYGLANVEPHLSRCARCRERVKRLAVERELFLEALTRPAPRAPLSWPQAVVAAALLLLLGALLWAAR